MLTQATRDTPVAQLVTELHRLQNQVSVLQTQGAAMLRLMSAMVGSMKELNARDGKIEREVSLIEKEFEHLQGNATSAATCPACGAPFEHHRAATGDLRVCTACGLSQFVDGFGIVRGTTLPVPPPAPSPMDTPTPWVG